MDKPTDVEIRYQSGGRISLIGKVDFEGSALRENLVALLADLNKAKPSSAKGIYIRRVTVSSTMGPGLSLDQSSLTI